MSPWIKAGFAIPIGLDVLALPDAWEGPLLVSISEGHAIRLLDALGLSCSSLERCCLRDER